MFETARRLTLAIAVGALAGEAAAQEIGDPAVGEKVFRKCMACHTIDAGGANRIGPNLHGVVGRVMGGVEDFKYSDAMATAGASDRVWTVEELNAFLENPKTQMPGTKMTFAGLKKAPERADLLAYLASQSAPAP